MTNAQQSTASESERVHEAIAAQCRQTPTHIAVVANTYRLSYAELDRRANGVANNSPSEVLGVAIWWEPA